MVRLSTGIRHAVVTLQQPGHFNVEYKEFYEVFFQVFDGHGFGRTRQIDFNSNISFVSATVSFVVVCSSFCEDSSFVRITVL